MDNLVIWFWAAVLMLVEAALRFPVAYRSSIRIPVKRWTVVPYLMLAVFPLLAFRLEQLYLPAFYLLYLGSIWGQDQLIPLSDGRLNRSVRVQFLTFGSLHLFSIGAAALLSPYSLNQLLDSPHHILNSTCFALVLTCLLKVRPILYPRVTGVTLRREQKKDFRFLFHFLNLGVLYIFLQSLLCLFHPQLDHNLSYFLCGNLVSVLLLHVYFTTLHLIFRVSHAEQSNSQLAHSLSQSDQRLDMLRANVHFDPLTKARSRLFLLQESTRLLDLQVPFALIYMDLNGLKAINDTRGHQAGDQYLCQFVQLLSAQIRTEDTLARFGGDEFILLLPHCSREHAQGRLEQIRSNIMAQSEEFTFGAGVVDTQEAQTLDGLIALADDRMYREKRARRTDAHA